jgi:hypothetical protein
MKLHTSWTHSVALLAQAQARQSHDQKQHNRADEFPHVCYPRKHTESQTTTVLYQTNPTPVWFSPRLNAFFSAENPAVSKID